ncbi:MAG: D-alanyl-D-alanine carboxypeptidase precursor [Labilithrix sp.]|nr:D-alanyl-D-alanine carboxypeptidase precursor [Labilithrix sp.]
MTTVRSLAPHVPWPLLVVSLAGVVVSAGAGCSDDDTQVVSTDAGTIDSASADANVEPLAKIEDLLEPLRERGGVPGLAALVMRGGVVIAEGATGVRKLGDPTPIGTTDSWYLGTSVQAFTATLAALVVEDGTVAWSSTLGGVFLDVPMHASYKDVTLELLLGHRGGAPASIPDAVMQAMRGAGTPQARRDEAVRTMLQAGPETAPALDVQRSDAGYLMAASMIERATGRSWEELLRTRVFDRLGMTGCTYDAQAAISPWGHRMNGAAVEAVQPDSDGEPPPAFGPAGRVRCPLRDWAKLCALHLAGARGEPTALLGPASFAKLHTAARTTYALGWNAVFRTWTGRSAALTHATSNTLFSGTVWLAPEKNIGFLVVTNETDDTSRIAADEVVGELVNRFVAR